MNRIQVSTAKRFRDARLKYNQNGSQTVEQVSGATGITKSNLGDLESSVCKPRNTGYLTVAKLAKHYGVSCDYLVGLTKYPGRDRDARSLCDGLGLSTGASAKLIALTHYENRMRALSVLLEDESFISILDALADCMDFRYWASFLEGEICNPEKMPNPDDGSREIQEILAEKDREAWRISRIFQPQFLMAKIAERLIEESESSAEVR